jgi:hypothetical protein
VIGQRREDRVVGRQPIAEERDAITAMNDALGHRAQGITADR